MSSHINNPPILLLPNEITAKIFTHCLPELPSADSHLLLRCPSPREATLLLGQICGQWRDICIGTPVFWSSIAFAKGSIQLLELWLSRARDHPLTIFLQMNDARADMLMKAIMVHRSRWRDVTLVLPVGALHQLSMSSLPRLERLTLRTNDLHLDPPIIIRDTPLLRYADLSFLPQLDLPFEQLTTLHSSLSFNATQAVGILRRCPNLLDLFWGRGFIFDAPILPPIELPCLRSLATDDGNLLHFLTVPRLERLEMSTHRAEAETLRLLMLRSSCDLRVFSLKDTDRTHKNQLQNLLCTVSTVMHLKLERASIETQMPALRGADVLPQLEHLEICESLSGEDSRPLLDELWRRHTQGTLKSLRLSLKTWPNGHEPRVPSADAMATFRALSEGGLRVRVTAAEVVILDL
ncbi:hypothetical protein DFH08DRAFT_1081817 [Mycena albidolilacea]|uniref:F-box domain-containing protein n=1 Tax=Mycena albidolilacea TaxID=1033008 RepID=A0AAD7EN84_9AGAR|nr:hypothetical protein DFH08DRAFT_1081817 [Mycena albidolilacea]